MPKPTDFPYRLESDRLVLRCYEPGDEVALVEAISESLDSLRPWMPWAQAEPTLEQFRAWVRRSRGDYDLMTNFNLAMIDRASGRFLGSSGLHRFDWEAGRFEIGYWLRDSAVGQGYVTEAARRLTRFCFEDLAAYRVEIRAEADNTRSRAVAERLGYVLEGILRAQSVWGGRARDMALYSLIRSDEAGRA